MIALRRGQCFRNEKNGEYVYIAEMKAGFHDNIIYCYVMEMDEKGEFNKVSDSLYTRQEIQHMKFMYQETEEYMEGLRRWIHDKNREH